jgi:uncharacterized protein
VLYLFKKIFYAFLISIVAVLFSTAAVNAASTQNVKDYMNYLSQGEVDELQDEINRIKNTCGLEAVIVITDKTDGKSSMEYADDYYDYNGYGVGNDYSGLLMLINMQIREVWISTTGKAISIYTDKRISAMVDNVTGPLSSGNYYSACNKFLEDVQKYGSLANETYLEKVVRLATSFPVYIIALVIAFVVTLIISLSSKGKVTINSLTYEESGTFELSGATDEYIREMTTKTKIETSSGSSTHRGSSGRSHGGGGGRF